MYFLIRFDTVKRHQIKTQGCLQASKKGLQNKLTSEIRQEEGVKSRGLEKASPLKPQQAGSGAGAGAAREVNRVGSGLLH